MYGGVIGDIVTDCNKLIPVKSANVTKTNCRVRTQRPFIYLWSRCFHLTVIPDWKDKHVLDVRVKDTHTVRTNDCRDLKGLTVLV